MKYSEEDNIISNIRRETIENAKKVSCIRTTPHVREPIMTSPWILRTIICICLFLGYIMMDKEKLYLGTYDSNYVRELIKSDISLEFFKDL